MPDSKRTVGGHSLPISQSHLQTLGFDRTEVYVERAV